MPTTRILLTLEEVRVIVAKHYNVNPACVDVFENASVAFLTGAEGLEHVTEDSYFVQIDQDNAEIK